jgi:nitrate/nitrite transporter NarK
MGERDGRRWVFLVDVHGLAPATAGRELAVAQACGAASRLAAGAWSDRVGSRMRPMRQLALVTALIMGALAAGAAVRSLWAVGALLAAVVLAVSTNGLSFTAVAEHAGPAWAAGRWASRTPARTRSRRPPRPPWPR